MSAAPAESSDTPTPKKGPGRPRRTDWQEPFLEQFTFHGIQAWAARAAKVDVDTVNNDRKRDPAFAARYDEAFELSTAGLERTAVEWAIGGLKATETRTHTVTKTDADGKVISRTDTTVTEKIDRNATLLIFLLKARRPEVYRESLRVEQTGADGGPVEIRVTKEEQDAAVERFGAEVVRLADAREARASSQSGGAG